MTDREAMNLALEALEFGLQADELPSGGKWDHMAHKAITALYQALSQSGDAAWAKHLKEPMSEKRVHESDTMERECNPHPDAPHGFNRDASHGLGRYVCDCEGWEPEPWDTTDMGIDRGAWDDVPDATKWVDELRGGDETEQKQRERELNDVLTERDDAEDYIDALLDEVLGPDRAEWSSAYGRADALEEVRERIAQMLKPSIDKAWNRFEAALEQQAEPEQEPVAWVKDLTSAQPRCVTDLKYISVADTEAGVQYIPLYAAPPKQAEQEPPTVAELLCVCGAGWEWRNRDWELVETPPPTQSEQTVSLEEYQRLQRLVTSQGIRLMEYESEQDPVAWISEDGILSRSKKFFDNNGIKYSPLYTAPPKREWQGLTSEEITKLKHLMDHKSQWSYIEFARAIEAKLKEKNS